MPSYFFLAVLTAALWISGRCAAQDALTIDWQMPTAPDSVAKLLKQTKVKWEFYDAASKPRKWPGLTHFDVKLEYRSVNHHRFTTTADGQTLQVSPQFRSVNLFVTHRIELPQSYQSNDFWERPLVLHELDHLKLSSHPYWIKAFKKRVQQIGTISQVWPLGMHASQVDRIAKQMVDEAVRKEFDAILQLIEIRYQELDRLTEHGLKPLPADYWEEAIPES